MPLPPLLSLLLYPFSTHGVNIPSFLLLSRPPIMPSAVVTTDSPHLRVSAAKNKDLDAQNDQRSVRIPPSESSIVEDQFFWTYTEEPHRSRRQAIIKAHPEVCSTPFTASSHAPLISWVRYYQVTKLCGYEPLTKYVVFGVVSLQICCAYLLRDTSMLSWRFLATAYLIGATANQNLFLAIHEISHNLAFRSPMGNRLLAIFANLPIGVPYSAAFRVCPAGYNNREDTRH